MREKGTGDSYLTKIGKALKNEFGIELLEIKEHIELASNFHPTALFVAKMGRNQILIAVEIKNEINHQTQIQKLIDFAAKFDGLVMLVSASITKKMKGRLKEKGVCYFEIDKGIFISLDFKLRADGNALKEQNFPIKQSGFRTESFTKLLLYFVCLSDALEFSQRKLATQLDLSLGSINKSLAALNTIGLVRTSNGRRFLGKFLEIETRWRFSLLDLKRDSLFIGRFSPSDVRFYNEWKSYDLKSVGSYWGGEPAAAIRSKYLGPESFTIFSYDENPSNLAKLLRLKKDEKGNIEIFRCFWPDLLNNKDGTIPDFVSYCELLNSGIDRNIETAKIMKVEIEKAWAKNGF